MGHSGMKKSHIRMCILKQVEEVYLNIYFITSLFKISDKGFLLKLTLFNELFYSYIYI